MPSLNVPFQHNRFQVNLEFNKIGQTNTNPVATTAVVDTGASQTCVGISLVNQLSIAPTGPVRCANTANGLVFTRQYPLRMNVENQIDLPISCLVTFSPIVIMTMQVPNLNSNNLNELQARALVLAFSRQQGVQLPSLWLPRFSQTQSGTEIKVYGPGSGINQSIVLLGMDFLSLYDWSFDKTTRSLTIQY